MLRWKSALNPGGGGSSDGSTPVAAGKPGSGCGKGCRGGHDLRCMAQRRSREPRNENERGSGGALAPSRCLLTPGALPGRPEDVRTTCSSSTSAIAGNETLSHPSCLTRSAQFLGQQPGGLVSDAELILLELPGTAG